MLEKLISVIRQKITNDYCVINYHNVIHPIVLFQLNEGTDSKGRYLNDLWQEDFYFYESCHDYIQWMFPLAEESEYNPDAPVLTEEDISCPHIPSHCRKGMFPVARGCLIPCG